MWPALRFYISSLLSPPDRFALATFRAHDFPVCLNYGYSVWMLLPSIVSPLEIPSATRCPPHYSLISINCIALLYCNTAAAQETYCIIYGFYIDKSVLLYYIYKAVLLCCQCISGVPNPIEHCTHG